VGFWLSPNKKHSEPRKVEATCRVQTLPAFYSAVRTSFRDNQDPRALDSVHDTRPICRNPSATRHMKRGILAIELRLRLKKAEFGLKLKARRTIERAADRIRHQTVVPQRLLFEVLGGHHDVYFAIMILWDSTKKVGGRTKVIVLIDGLLPGLQPSYKR
jgi:hypothetical protein